MIYKIGYIKIQAFYSKVDLKWLNLSLKKKIQMK